MKREKVSKAFSSKSGNEEAETAQVEIGHSCCSITDLPSHVLADILFRLSTKEIVVCKSVCKSLYAKISSPDFAQSVVLPIARKVDPIHVSRILHPFEIDQDGRSMDMFLFMAPGCPGEFQHLDVTMDFDTKLKIPVRNFPMVLRDTIEDNEEISLKAEDHGYMIVNSCNGLLCLSEPSLGNPIVVCNPFTGEFINLPRVNNVVEIEDYIDCGFGYSPNTNQYKVVRIFQFFSPVKPNTLDRVAQVHILGTGSWKNIGCTGSLKNIESAPYPGYKFSFPTYLNGAVHWFCHLEEKLSHMISFDCEKEHFLPFLLPPLTDTNRNNVGMGVLEGCICICDSSNLTSICVWVMKNYGVEKSWTQLFKIDMSRADKPLYGLYQPLKYLNNGALLMFNYPRGFLIYYDPRKPKLLILTVCPSGSIFEIVPHTPSFTSFKHLLAGCNVEVLNVYSRCAVLKLKGEDREARGISLCEKTDFFHFILDPDRDPVRDEYDLHECYRESSYDEYWWGKYVYMFSKIWMRP